MEYHSPSRWCLSQGLKGRWQQSRGWDVLRVQLGKASIALGKWQPYIPGRGYCDGKEGLGHHWSLEGREGSSCEQVPCSSSVASSLGQAERRKGL